MLIVPLATVALGAILSLGIAASLKWMQPSVYKPFSPTYYALKEKLGAPKADAEPVVNSYIAQHYNETAIWIERPFKTWFFLAFHSGKWSEAGDPYPRENSTFFNDDCNRKRFGTPKGFYPPYGGLAVLWEKNVVEWKDRMGWRRWHCHHGGVVYLQKFDGGYILGPFSSGPDKIEAQIFVLTNDQKWLSREALEVEAPSCMVLTDPEATGPCPIPIEPLSQ